MAMMVGTPETLIALLKQLTGLENDAIEAYTTAIARVEDAGARRQLGTFLADHQRHALELTRQLRALNAEAPTGTDGRQVLPKGRAVLTSLVGDRALLGAMKTNEDETNAAYERAVARTEVPMNLRSLFESYLADERRHRQWIESWLAPGAASRTAPR